MARVLVIGDLHLPAEREDYLDFCRSVKKKYRTDTTVFIGDVIDHHSISFHDKFPDSPNAKDEHADVMLSMADWKKSFKEAKVCIGNHDAFHKNMAINKNEFNIRSKKLLEKVKNNKEILGEYHMSPRVYHMHLYDDIYKSKINKLIAKDDLIKLAKEKAYKIIY